MTTNRPITSSQSRLLQTARDRVQPISKSRIKNPSKREKFEGSQVSYRFDGSVLHAEAHFGGLITQYLPKVVDGVFEGGGTLGTAYVGALRALQDQKIWFKRVSGTSAGSITAAMIAAGYDARAISWLTSPEEIRSDTRPSNVPQGVSSVNFNDFLDFPRNASEIPREICRKTILWNAIYNTAIDVLLDQALSAIPIQSELVDDITNQIMNIEIFGQTLPSQLKSNIADSINTALEFLPDESPTVGDMFPITTVLRRNISDNVWDVVANGLPGYPFVVNAIYRGGACLGEEFLDVMEALLKAKISPSDRSTVCFKDLPLELTVIAANTTTQTIEVYCSKTHGDMSVAEAVRRSMSVPFLFVPRMQGAHEIMDGGMCSNYPYWVYAKPGSDLGYTTHTQDDENRPKLGLILEDNMATPSQWGCRTEKFCRNGVPYTPSNIEGLAASSGDTEMFNSVEATIEMEMFERIFSVFKTMTAKESYFHKILSKSVMNPYDYHEVKIPMLGYHWLDFSVNTDPGAFLGMADRGWVAAITALQEGGMISTKEVGGITPEDSPFRF